MSDAPWRVLAADDDPTARLLMQAALGGDFVVTLVADGNDALAAFQASAFDIVLLDVEMPGLDGFAVCAAIRRTHAALPVILVTGRSDPEFLEQAGRLAAAYLAKPIDWTSLAGHLRSMLAAG